MQNLYDNLKELLQKDERLVVDGKLLKNKIIELALAMDASLLKLLLTDAAIKKHFFTDVSGVLVFDKIKFQKFISNKQFLPNSYTAFKNKIGLTVNDEYISESKDVVLAWPYKDCVLEGGQSKEDAKRNEVFWNETLAPDEIDQLLSPKVLTNFKKYDKKGEHKVSELSFDDNLVIKGNNLLVLHTLLKVYRGKIKLIYIDPPYNTGNDSFLYNDSFNHSAWLIFIKNRLEVAKELLTKDGFIFISIDDNEHPYLRTLCNEIFKKENFISDIVIQSNKGGRDYLKIAKSHEYLICYQKSALSELNEIEKADGKYQYEDLKGGFNIRELRNRNPKFHRGNRPNLYFPYYVNDKKFDDNGFCAVSLEKKSGYDVIVYPKNSLGDDSCWRWGNIKAKANISDDVDKSEIIAKKKSDNGWNIYEKHRKLTGKVKSIWDDSPIRTEAGTKELRKLLENSVFPFPKPVELIKRVVQIATNDGDIVLDFFGGSGTTAQAVIEANVDEKRVFILCEQLGYVENITIPRVQKIIKEDSFIYTELAFSNQQFIDEIQSAKTKAALQKIWAAMQQKAFISYNVDIASINDKASGFDDLTLEEQQRFLIEILDKNMLYVPYTSIDDNDYNISESDKKLNKMFYEMGK